MFQQHGSCYYPLSYERGSCLMLSSVAITLHLFGSFYFHKDALVFVKKKKFISPNCSYIHMSLGLNSRSFSFWPQSILTVSTPFPQPRLHILGFLCIPQHSPLLYLCSCIACFSQNSFPIFFSTCKSHPHFKVLVLLLPLLSSLLRTVFPGVLLLQCPHKF